jgi:hypothetical protein
MSINYLKMIFGLAVAVLCISCFVRVAGADNVRELAGEITWIDTKTGKLQFKADVTPATGEVTVYRITEHETRVTTPSDSKFLSITDLQPGQYVTLYVVDGKEGQILQKIMASARPGSTMQEAYGVVESIDAAGSIVLAGRPLPGTAEIGGPTEFVFEPKSIIVMQSPSSQPVQLQVKPGDVVKVEYMMKEGKRQAHSITLYADKVTH